MAFPEEQDQNQTELDLPSSKAFGFKDIVLMHLRKILTLASCELRGGYYTVFTTKNDEEKEIYIEDTREALSNGILIFALLLEPNFNDNTKEAYKKFNDGLDTIKKEFLEASSVSEKVVLGEAFYGDQKDKLLLETYKQQKMAMFIKLLSTLSFELAEKNYLEIGGGTF